MMKSKNYLSVTRSTSSRKWLWAIVVLSMLGLGASIYLSFVHWSVHNLPGHRSSCAINQKINCDTVALSQYSIVAGVPISIWSSLFFVSLLMLVTWGQIKKSESWPRSLLGLLNLISLATSTPLFLISELVIQSFCIYCVFIYHINLLIGVTWTIGFRPKGTTKASSTSFLLLGPNLGFVAFLVSFPSQAVHSATFWILWVIIVALWIFFLFRGSVTSWSGFFINAFKDLTVILDRPSKALGLVSLAVAGLLTVLILVPKMYPDHEQVIADGVENITVGKTTEGHNWIGAYQPEVVIVEYSDYECPFCRKAHEVVRQVVRERKNWLRMVHVHVPLDHSCNAMVRKPFHLHACDCAKAAICADRQGHFWKMNDALFLRRCGLDSVGLAVLAQNLGLELEPFRNCMKTKSTEQVLQKNIQACLQVAKECMKMGKSFGTPMFDVSGEVVMGYREKAFWIEKLDSIRQAQLDQIKKSR